MEHYICEGVWDLHSEAHAAFQIVRLAVLDEVVDNQHRKEEDDRLKALEVQRHVAAHDPAEDDQERRHKERNLQTAANGHIDGEVHLALVRDDHGRHVLGRISDNRDEDETDERFVDVRRFDNSVDAVNEVVGTECNNDSYQDESDHGRDRRENVTLLLTLLFVSTFLRLDVIEELVVRVKLKDDVENVEEEENDGSTTRQELDVGIFVCDVVVTVL